MTFHFYTFLSALGIIAPRIYPVTRLHDRAAVPPRPVSACLGGAVALAALLMASPVHADEDALLERAAAAATEATSHHFPPPPAVAPEAATRIAMAVLPQPPRDPYIFEKPRAPAFAPAPGEEALARAAIRTVSAFATPAWITSPRAKAGRWARVVGENLEAELRCLALNVYWEARSESALGRLAVAAVTLNRVAHRDFPGTICGVVRQGEEQGLNRCQFSWVCDRRSNEPGDNAAWRDAEYVAFSALFLNLPDPTRGALWYHADYVSPPWASTMTEAMRIGRHLFYRRPARTIEAARGATG